jgi:hypothetical protein
MADQPKPTPGAVIHEDVIVYAAPGGINYVANFENLGWQRWPAVAHGWLSRQGCPAALVDSCHELEPKLGDLALRLSGVTS